LEGRVAFEGELANSGLSPEPEPLLHEPVSALHDADDGFAVEPVPADPAPAAPADADEAEPLEEPPPPEEPPPLPPLLELLAKALLPPPVPSAIADWPYTVVGFESPPVP
jgi:hypothetical protein